MLIGHLTTYRVLEHVINGLTVRELVSAESQWRAERLGVSAWLNCQQVGGA
jgi:hypothetical protein